ncbi:hypothetical protein COB55_01085 [Candidatus Wolfebacteria bacterium]|nr:MAG: hypothetical protein COB55_01085 [Candidatus Wolfebacteria bacterium]
MNVEVNFIALIVAAVASMVIGMAWYSQALFGSSWAKAAGLSSEALAKIKRKGMGRTLITALVASIVMGYVLVAGIALTGANSFAAGAELGFWVWLGFIATTSLGIVLWEGKPWKLWIINNSYQLISVAVMGGILASW